MDDVFLLMKIDYSTMLAKQRRLVDYLNEQIIETQQHDCYDITEVFKNKLEVEKRVLEELEKIQ